MQTDETIDRYFYITGWICIAVFAALAAVIGVCGTQILTKVPPCPLPYTAVFGGWFMLSQTLQRISRGRLHIGMHFRPLYMWLALAIIVVNCIVKNMLILFCGIHLLK